MQRGDVILTPPWKYHDHGKEGTGAMIWLDGLDIPLFQHFPVHFVEHYPEPRYPAESGGMSDLTWSWEQMKAEIDASSHGSGLTSREYLHKNGEEISTVLGASAERVIGLTPTRQETSSSVYHVIEGEGEAVIDGKVLDVTQGDTFCVPSWKMYRFEGNMYLFRLDDNPMLKKLGFYRNRDFICSPYD